MKTIEIESLHDHAARLYAAGQYEGARSTWEAILSADPEDEQAAEGLRMVEILSGEQGQAPGTRMAAAAGPLDEGLEREIVGVEALLIAAREAEGVRAALDLCEAHPENPEIRWLAASARERFESGPFIAEALDSARRSWRRGDLAQVRDACARILVVDPDHTVAREALAEADAADGSVLSRAGQTERPAPGPAASHARLVEQPAPGPAASHAGPVEQPAPGPALSHAGLVEQPAPGPAELRRASESASGSLFEMDPDLSDAQPLRLSTEEPDETSFAGAFEAREPQDPSDFKFAELEEEIDETLSVIELTKRNAPQPAEADHPEREAPAGASDGHAAAAGASVPAGEAAFLAADLAFGDEFQEQPQPEPAWQNAVAAPAPTMPAAPPGGNPSADPRVVALLEEARADIDAGRYSDAIETASRVFAIDAESPEAQEVIDLARARLDEVDRQSEEHLYNAQKFLEEGDDTAAEALLREVLRTHPGHREAIDMLAKTTREKGGEDVIPVPLEPSWRTADRDGDTAAATQGPSLMREDRPGTFPAVEPFTPRPSPSEPDLSAAAAPAAAGPAPAAVASGPSVYRFVFYAVLALLLLGIAAIGLRLLPRFLIGEESPSVVSPAAKHPATKDVLALVSPAPKPGGSAPRAAPADPAAGIPRTLEQGRALLSEGKLKEARSVLEDVVRANPGNRQAVDLLNVVAGKMRDGEHMDRALDSIRGAFKQERYEDSLRMLYRLPQDLQKGEVELGKRNCWYNNAILFLLGGNGTEAVRCFREALEIDPRDGEAKRLIEFVRTYDGREKDASYFRYVESLPRRPFDAP